MFDVQDIIAFLFYDSSHDDDDDNNKKIIENVFHIDVKYSLIYFVHLNFHISIIIPNTIKSEIRRPYNLKHINWDHIFDS